MAHHDRTCPSLFEVERRHILNVLYLCENNRTRAANVLGISVRGLRNKLNEYAAAGWDVPPSSGQARTSIISSRGPRSEHH